MKELGLGRMLGPFTDADPLPPVHINRFGVIPKGHNTGKFRLITDLSFPANKSVNDGIDKGLCSMVYIRVDEVAAIATRMGPGALMAKGINYNSLFNVHCKPPICKYCIQGFGFSPNQWFGRGTKTVWV